MDAGSLTANLDPGHGETSPDFDALCAAFEGALSTEEALNYEGDGEFRYFGPTSGRLQFLCDSMPEQSQAAPPLQAQAIPADSTAANSRAEMNRRILAENDDGLLISEDLKSELVDLYFTWQNPWLLVVDENLYRKSLKTRGRYWSPLLENCILALGSRFTDIIEVRADPDDANSAGQFFFDRAEVYLSYELKYPSITTIQSLFLLSTLSVVSPFSRTKTIHGAKLLCSLQAPTQRPGCAREWPSSSLLIWGSILTPKGFLVQIRYRPRRSSLGGCYIGPCIATTSWLLLTQDASAHC